MAPVARGWFGACIDRIFAWRKGLPPETCSYTVDDVRIPVDDGLDLIANLYQPVGTKPVGTLLVRGPYGLGIPFSLWLARIFAARGYQVLFSGCRGTSGCEGELDPGRYESADGHATVRWMRDQPWYTGSFATIGPSYLGYVQWALLSDPPPDMMAAVISSGPHDLSEFVWGTGALNADFIAWAAWMPQLRSSSIFSLLVYLQRQRALLRPLYDAVPLLSTIEDYFGVVPKYLRNNILEKDLKKEFWKPLQQGAALEKANIPILLVTGWNDLIQPYVMNQYRSLAERDCTVALTVGPWTHGGAAGDNTVPETLRWLEEHYGRPTVDTHVSPVRMFYTGANEWRSLPRWPPSTNLQELFLWPDRTLQSKPPVGESPASEFTFDPTSPTPSLGAPELFEAGWSPDDTPLGTRSDVAVFLTQPFAQDVEVCGRPTIELHHSSNQPFVDVLVLLSEVSAQGRSYSLTEKYIRLDDTRTENPLCLTFNDVAHVFKKGTRLRLLVAGGSHPRYIRNLGSGEHQGTGTTLVPSHHTIRHEAGAASKLLLGISVGSVWRVDGDP